MLLFPKFEVLIVILLVFVGQHGFFRTLHQLPPTDALTIVSESFAIIASFVVFILAYVGLREYLTRPKFVIGVIPSSQEILASEPIYHPVLYDEAHFNVFYLAAQIKDVKTEALVRKELARVKKEKCRTRNLLLSEARQIELYIVLQNVGKREATKYTLAITFDTETARREENIKLLDVQAEELDLQGLYVHNKSRLINRKLGKFLPSDSICNKYKDLALSQDYVLFRDSLEGYGFELVNLKIEVPDEVHDFFIFFRIDCPGIFHRRQIFAQYLTSKRED